MIKLLQHSNDFSKAGKLKNLGIFFRLLWQRRVFFSLWNRRGHVCQCVCSNEKPCCHTKHRNFPLLTSAFCARVFPSYDPNSSMPLSYSRTFHRGVAWRGWNVICLTTAINTGCDWSALTQVEKCILCLPLWTVRLRLPPKGKKTPYLRLADNIVQ